MPGYDLVTDSPTKRIYEAVKRIPKGHVATYGKIAEMAGDHRMARAVGNALHKNPDPEHIPCFRVVNAKGELAGDKRTIVRYKDWNICLQVCYDLRFPVWSRNVDNEYDLLIYVANWPEARKKVWKTLLQARAMENMAYVCGVNRVGIDGKGFVYRGDSMIFSPKGKKLADAGKREEVTRTCTLTRADLEDLRGKFPAWKDADAFEIK